MTNASKKTTNASTKPAKVIETLKREQKTKGCTLSTQALLT
jgi:hypothetical protein